MRMSSHSSSSKASRGYPDAAAFLSRYNVAQLQAALYRAETMTVTATRDLKTIVRYAKLATPAARDRRARASRPVRASHERMPGDATSAYRITFSGPASVLRETRRYGVNFARFLPALLACKGWELTAVVQTPWKATARLVISDADRFTSHLPPPEEFDSGSRGVLREQVRPGPRRLAV